jgi:hypothetical protein
VSFTKTDIRWTDDPDIQQRFEEKYEEDPETGCWEWQAWKKEDGYGRFARSRGDYPYAHRISYQIHKGPIPDGLQINHHCDNRGCVNPDHLYAGTPQENVQDAIERTGFLEGRIGENAVSAKLTASDVREIRERYKREEITHRELAGEYGVSHTAVGRAIRGESWGHLGGEE